MLKANCIDKLVSTTPLVFKDHAEFLAFLTSAFAALREGGKIDILLTHNTVFEYGSTARMVGFQNTMIDGKDSTVRFESDKAVMSSGPAKIKRKPKADVEMTTTDSNPWANLDSKEGKLIDEDALLQSGENTTAKKFCGDNDTMQAAKPCANCTCGLKE